VGAQSVEAIPLLWLLASDELPRPSAHSPPFLHPSPLSLTLPTHRFLPAPTGACLSCPGSPLQRVAPPVVLPGPRGWSCGPSLSCPRGWSTFWWRSRGRAADIVASAPCGQSQPSVCYSQVQVQPGTVSQPGPPYLGSCIELRS